jgi:hypothetical protein
MTTGASTSFAAVPQDGNKPVFVPIESAHHGRACCAAGLSPANSIGASDLLQ